MKPMLSLDEVKKQIPPSAIDAMTRARRRFDYRDARVWGGALLLCGAYLAAYDFCGEAGELAIGRLARAVEKTIAWQQAPYNFTLDAMTEDALVEFIEALAHLHPGVESVAELEGGAG